MATKRKQTEKSKLEAQFKDIADEYVEAGKLPQYEREFAFVPKRRFSADFAFPQLKVIIEIQGGVWVRGKHARAWGIVSDYKRLNLAAMNGYRVFQFDASMLREGHAQKALDALAEEWSHL